MSTTPAPLDLVFDRTPEIFATDTAGAFLFPLTVKGRGDVPTAPFDEVRLVVSVWHPSGQRAIDLDRAYLELRGCFDPEEKHWSRLAEIEPVVPPNAGGDSFDGWIVLPILGSSSSFALAGTGFEPRARIQVRANAYFVA